MSGLVTLRQVSLKFSLTSDKVTSDLTFAFTGSPNVVGFTEVPKHIDELIEVSKTAGYDLYWPGKGDCAIAWRGDHELLARGTDWVVPAGAAGKHTDRGISWAYLMIDGTFTCVTEAHWLTGFTRSKKRRGFNNEMNDALKARLKQATPGRMIGFWMGDTNVSDEKEDQRGWSLDDPPFLSIYDELQVWPGTHSPGRTIDLIGKWTGDLRVKGQSVTVHPKGESDHSQVTGQYLVP